jgi:hypothetical protein
MKKIALLVAGLACTAAYAGPEKIKYPSNYLKGVLYQDARSIGHTCHLPHANQDFVISLAKLNNTFPGAQALAKGRKAETAANVNIAMNGVIDVK